MKHFYSILFFLIITISNAQDIIQANIDGNIASLKAGTQENPKTEKQVINSFIIVNYTLPTGHSLKVTGPDGTPKSLVQADLPNPVSFADNLVEKQVTIELMNGATATGKSWAFTITNTKSTETNTNTNTNFNFDDYLNNVYNYIKTSKELTITPFGIIDKEGRVNIYIDYRGNNLLTTIPQGISNAQYVVHVITPYSSKDLNPTIYTIKQRSGSFDDALNFRNTGAANTFKENGAIKYETVRDDKFLLSTATDNIDFDLVAVQNQNSTITKTVIENYTIKMTPTYQGSFDIGFVKTELANPTYSLINSPDGLTQTVKVTDDGKSEGVATIMATFYYSPIVILESLLGKKTIPFYKLNGRNFLDDHKIYERFYPTVGVGLNDKVFENLFIGINWEVVRGFALFYGWNYRKVNTFEMPNFESGSTPVTEDQFNYYTNEKWKTKPAFGIKLDLLVVKGLFGKGN
ncbi:hypothetical protein [Flavobacterium pectinovorum]|uniref:hypothetical protein n=1 Tax=Flavobacterium pectinovorum TaxID=29533 RepID=UPI001FAB50F8|nr:hypothetical protein [Flavobacterium pectinovorum]MCI9843623.1 hypothetical protein [Flavobacterium pectinovorum]